MANDNVGFLTKKKPFTSGETPKATTSDAQKAKDTALRAKQDAQSAKERESDKGRFNKQVANAKAEAGMYSANKQYTKPSAPAAKASAPAAKAVSKPAAKASAPAVKPAAKTRMSDSEQSKRIGTALKGFGKESTSAAKAAPAKKPVAKEVMVNKTTGAKFDMDKMRAAKSDWESKHPSQGLKCGGKAYAKGGSVTRADGCATKGHTKGRMR